MTRPVAPDDLSTLGQLAELLGVVPSALSNWQRRDVAFPEPWGSWYLGGKPYSFRLWVTDDVLAWWAAREAEKAASRERRAATLRAQLAKLEGTVR